MRSNLPEAAAQRLITPAVSDLDDLPPAPPLSERQLRSRAAFERLADASSIR